MFILVVEIEFTGFVIGPFYDENQTIDTYDRADKMLFFSNQNNPFDYIEANFPEAIEYQILGNKEYFSSGNKSSSNGFVNLYLLKLEDSPNSISLFILERMYGNDNYSLEDSEILFDKYGFNKELSAN